MLRLFEVPKISFGTWRLWLSSVALPIVHLFHQARRLTWQSFDVPSATASAEA